MSTSHSTISTETSKPSEKTSEEVHDAELKSMHVVSNISNRYAHTVVTSKYFNSKEQAKETTFSIILPNNAFIAGFVMEIKGKQYEAYVKEKEEAKLDYEQAVSRGIAAAHVGVSARDSNDFTVSVNVEPLSEVTFILTYEELLIRKHSKYELVVNLHPVQFIDEFGVDIYINETRPIVHLETPALRSGNEIINETTKNELAVIEKNDEDVYHISFYPTIEQQKQMDKNLREQNGLSLSSENNGIAGQFVIEYDVERDPKGGEVLVSDGYFVHFFAPTDLKPIAKHVIFILDVSASMSGRKLEQVKEAMLVILDQLNSNDYFNIVKFSDDICVLNNDYSWELIKNSFESKLPQSFETSEKNINNIKEVIKELKYEGSTNISDALVVGMRLTSKGILHLNETDNTHKPQPIIVFLTDGQPNIGEINPKNIIELVASRNDCKNKPVIFTLAFGGDADDEFLKELAIKNSGFMRKIYEAADASLQLQDFYKQISCPLLTNVNFKYPEQVQETSTYEFDVLFDGSEFVVVGKMDEMIDDFVVVEASTLEGRNQFYPNIQKHKYGNLERLWAYITIKQLLEKKYETKNLDEINNKEIEDTPEKEALRLALKYSFVTSVTSLVVVKPDEDFPMENLEKQKLRDEILSVLYDRVSTVQERCCSFNASAQPTRNINDILSDITEYVTTSTDKFFGKIFSLDRKKLLKFPKNVISTDIGLKSINIDCNFENNILYSEEQRTYVNFTNQSKQIDFILHLPSDSVITEMKMINKNNNKETIFCGKDHKDALEEYKLGMKKNVNICLVEIQNKNTIKVTLFIVPQSTVLFIINYKKHIEINNNKREIIINLNFEPNINKLQINLNINETSQIKEILQPQIIYEKIFTDAEVSTNKTNDNKVHIEFISEADELRDIITSFNKCCNYCAKFIIKYEIQYNELSENYMETSVNVVPYNFLVAVENNK